MRKLPVVQRMWWWVYSGSNPGIISGPYETEADALETNRIVGGFVKGLPTSRLDDARRWELKYRRVEKKMSEQQQQKLPKKPPRRKFDFD